MNKNNMSLAKAKSIVKEFNKHSFLFSNRIKTKEVLIAESVIMDSFSKPIKVRNYKRSVSVDFCKRKKLNLQNYEKTLDKIKELVYSYFNIDPSYLTVRTRKREIVIPRQIFQHISYVLGVASLPEMNKYCMFNHTTIMSNLNTVQDLITYNKKFNEDYCKLNELAEQILDGEVS